MNELLMVEKTKRDRSVKYGRNWEGPCRAGTQKGRHVIRFLGRRDSLEVTHQGRSRDIVRWTIFMAILITRHHD